MKTNNAALYLRRHKALILSILMVLQGCALTPSENHTREAFIGPRGLPEDKGDMPLFWWQACFRMPYSGVETPNWAIDVMLAQRVVRPALERHAEGVNLWRFHRRAGVDEAGHQFSLLFYATEITAIALFNELEAAPLVKRLAEAGYSTGMVRNCRGGKPEHALSAHSDPAWNKHLRQAWPYFIMGASVHWLALVEGVDREIGVVKSDEIDEQLHHYEAVNSKVTAIWRSQGQHAYLHQLAAIFGYEPLEIQMLMQF